MRVHPIYEEEDQMNEEWEVRQIQRDYEHIVKRLVWDMGKPPSVAQIEAWKILIEKEKNGG
jgi:hypothetical protein